MPQIREVAERARAATRSIGLEAGGPIYCTLAYGCLPAGLPLGIAWPSEASHRVGPFRGAERRGEERAAQSESNRWPINTRELHGTYGYSINECPGERLVQYCTVA